MPFTNAEKVKIRTLLGYQNAFRYKNTRLESALEADQVDDDGVAIIREELAAIAEIDQDLRAGGNAFISAGVAVVDKSLKFSTKRDETTLAARCKQGRIHISRIAVFFGIEILSDYYGTSGYGGDPWSRGMGSAQNARNFDIKLG